MGVSKMTKNGNKKVLKQLKFNSKDTVRNLKVNAKDVKPATVEKKTDPNDMRPIKLAQIRHLMNGQKCEDVSGKSDCLNHKHCGWCGNCVPGEMNGPVDQLMCKGEWYSFFSEKQVNDALFKNHRFQQFIKIK